MKFDHYDATLGMEHYLTHVWQHYGKRPGRIHPRSWGDGVMPLWEFGSEHLGRILDACARDKPPARFGGEPGIYQVESRAWHEWHWTRSLRLRYDETYTPRHRHHIPDSVRRAVYARDGHACLHCGTTERLSLDHIYPYSLGGEDTIENLQTLCRPCNSRKGVRV